MKSLLSILIVVLSAANFCLAQKQTTTSLSWIPKEMKGEMVFVEKYSEITRVESNDIVNIRTVKGKRDECLANINSYNLVFRRKINYEIETVFDKHKLDNIKTLSTRDISENLDNNIRFVLKAEFSSEDLVKGGDYSPKYYLYDQEKGIRYKSFTNLEIMLKSLKSYNWYAENRITDETTQAKIDDYVERNMPSEPRQLMSRSTKAQILAALGFAGIFAINAVIE